MATSRLVETERPQTRAVVKYIGRSAYKVRQVADLIRGKDAEESQNILMLCNRGAAEEVGKLLNSAMANASENQNIPGEELMVKEIFVDEGPTMKRFKPRARGRASSIRKRMCHITIVLERKADEAIAFKATKESGTGAANAREQRRRRAEASKAKQAEKATALEAEELDAAEESSAPANAEAKASDPVATADDSKSAKDSAPVTKKKPAAKAKVEKEDKAETKEEKKPTEKNTEAAEKKPATKKAAPKAEKTEKKEGDK